ncbi:molybdopterin-dependent oxidoreductase [Leekyejoonella antrihumi]|uniref:Asp-tRNA(Asn)/Glu-tRNA(Gln) amidotransferase GatCAB subunit C n=1 Tax=Leekyejoonella antrihumi TaxID=1660198 RepID=A0A563DP88_9MICO|nr:molybdopterin-dependent oxidoreductase [Leekyejoonella antrihumi]TWP32015.1 Asp-tRNA(Asn)/Glu-tRNA(Gln) amidotransferase GatCAB subunit C [Leekyejoonella antrihumi]
MSAERSDGPKRTTTATHWGRYDVETKGGRIVAIDPVADDLEPSPIGPGIVAALGSRARILRPAVRRGWLEGRPREGTHRRGADEFVELSWDEALDLAAGSLAGLRDRYGNDSVFGGSYGWGSSGRFHHAQSQVHRFLAMAGGYTGSLNSYSCAAMEVILPHVIGGTGFSILGRTPRLDEIAANCELVVAFGGLPVKNRQVNDGGTGLHRTQPFLRRCRDAGVRFVNVSPIRDDMSTLVSAEWLPLRPNTDVALMMALAHTLIAEDRHDKEFLATRCVGFGRLEDYLMGAVDGVAKDAEWAAPITEIPADVIQNLARSMAERRSLVTVGWSIQRADHGEQPYWMAVALAAMTGWMREPGCGFGSGYGSMQGIGIERARQRIAALPQPDNPVDVAIPVARICDALENPGATIDYDGRRITFPDLRAIYWCGGNPFHHHQDLNRLVEAWQRPDLVIVNESWWTATAKFADIIFPVATFLERNDFAAGSNDPWLCAQQKACEPPRECLTDYEVFCRLADRLGFGSRYSEERSADEWVRHLYEKTRQTLGADGVELPNFEDFWRRGRVKMPTPPGSPAGDLVAFARDPMAAPLATPSGRIELFSATVDGFRYDDCPGHPVWMEPAEWLGSPLARRFSLHLISNQPHMRLHSQYDHGGASQASKVADREPIRIHPLDAAARGITSGDIARVFNDRGACLAGVLVDDAVRPGVVQLSTGAWFDPAEPSTAGSLERHGNPNVLTLDKGTSRLAQGPSAHTTLVDVERWTGEAPCVAAFDPPHFASHQGELRPPGVGRAHARGVS